MCNTRVSFHLLDDYLRGCQWLARLGVLRRIGWVAIDVVHDPFIQETLHVLALAERADLVAHDALEVMRKSVAREQVRQPRGQVRIGGGIGIVVFGRFLQRLRADEGRDIGIFPVQSGMNPFLASSASRRSPIAISVGHFMSVPPSSVGNECTGKSSTTPPPSTPRIAVHQPKNLNARLMFTAIAYAEFAHENRA